MDAKRFVWKNIVTLFGIPHTLISENGFQFDSKTFIRYCCDLGITNRYSTPTYPQGNGQAEAVNKVIVNGLKKRLDDAKENWVEELSPILWTYQTTPRRSTRKTPFSMTYGHYNKMYFQRRKNYSLKIQFFVTKNKIGHLVMKLILSLKVQFDFFFFFLLLTMKTFHH